MKCAILTFASLTVLSASAQSFAQTPATTPEVQTGTGTGVEQATKGSTTITAEKFQTQDKTAAEETKDATELSVSAGGLSSSGNSRLIGLTTVEKFRLRLDDDQFKAAAAGNYARSALPGADVQTTVQNIQGLARYDRFFGNVSLFFSSQARNDKFQGLDVRFQEDPGVAYYFFNEKTLQLWTELAYDLLHDIRRKDSLVVPTTNERLSRTRTVHSGRVFVGYEHALSDSSKLAAGIEYIQGISQTDLWRINADVSLTAKVIGALSISASFSERYESKPLPGKEKLDTVAAGSLVYTLL